MQTPFGERLQQWSADPSAPHAVVMPGREMSYAEFLGRVENCARWLVAEGCLPGEIVGVTIADELTNLTVTLALMVLGVPQVCLPTHDPAPMREVMARRLAVSRIVSTRPEHALPGRTLSLVTPDALRSPSRLGPLTPIDADPDATAHYFTSSGTTGEPKIIPMSQRLLAQRAGHSNLAPGERQLLLTTVDDFPARSARLRCAYMGRTSVLQRSESSPPESAQAICAGLRVTRLDLGVLQATGLAPDRPSSAPFPAGLRIFASGSRVPARLRDAYAASGVALYVDYGAREASGISSTYPVDPDPSLETVGPPLPSAEVEIVDGEGNAVPRGEIGEIRVRTTAMIHAYHRDPVATSRHFKDGWFHPGDLGSLTANGSLCLHGRADDMMNMNGIKIFPAEIERVLEGEPTVRAAAAFALPSSVHGDIPVAAVELHDPATHCVAALLARARERLGVRSPRKIFVVDALPRNATGKVLKRELVSLLSQPDAHDE